jgi:pimeloyl-ACP methyl ester carboxylesterase
MTIHSAPRPTFLWIVALAFFASALSPAAAEVLVDGVPLPSDVTATVNADPQPDVHKRLSGAWVGSWGDTLKHILVVERISDSGEASVVYAVGDLASAGIKRSWNRYKASVSGDTLIISSGFTAAYKLVGDTLRAEFERGSTRGRAIMSKADIATLLASGEHIAWSKRQVEFLNTDLVENGKPIRLEVVLFKPDGDGPFPLVVFNHGSTGSGTIRERFTRTWWNFGLAEFFLDKGWMIAFPQRRGRGRSDGLYDEGFAPLRANGYSCDSTRSLPGADRALTDIEAAVSALLRRSDVSHQAILIGGNSRGGALSVAYSGKHPDQVLGVINFVGGWISEGCGHADQINKTIFQQGASYGLPTLWLYGKDDRYYSIAHSRSNFEAFQKAGGKGTFVEFDVGVINGHDLIANPALWKSAVSDYLHDVRGGLVRPTPIPRRHRPKR